MSDRPLVSRVESQRQGSAEADGGEGEVERWERHSPEVLQGMLDSIAKLRADGLDVIED
jgi:hypothetical protein